MEETGFISLGFGICMLTVGNEVLEDTGSDDKR